MSSTFLRRASDARPAAADPADEREAVLRAVLNPDQLPSPPVVALQIVHAASRPQCSPAEVVALLNQDPVLCARLLKAVNSCLYGLRQPVASVNRAVVVLGLNSVRSLALGLSLPAVRGGRAVDPGMREYWIGSVAGAILARELAARLRRPAPDDDLASGLLCDLGELLLRQAFPDRWVGHVARHGEQLVADPCGAERESFGIDHADVSAELLRGWNLPEDIVEPIRYHHDPHRLANSVRDWQARAELLQFATTLARLDDVAQDPVLLDRLLTTARGRFHMSCPELVAFLQQVAPKIEEFAQLVNQDLGHCPDYAAILSAGAAELVNLAVEHSRDRLSDAVEVATTVRLPPGVGVPTPLPGQLVAPDLSAVGRGLPAFRHEFLTQFPASGCRLGEYELRHMIGSGAMGLVFKAFEPSLGREVAVKMLAPQLAATAAARRRFARESRLAAAIQQENVVAVYAVGEATGIPYLAMEYVRGGCLESQIEQCGPFPLQALIATGRQIAAGLAAAHAKDIIHRDVKPGNILIEADTGRVKLTDFGLARVANDGKLSTEGFMAGTPLYMAPSVILGQAGDHLSDLFSLGGVLYAMATGTPPFRGQTMAAVFHAVCETDPVPPRVIRPDLPAWLDDVILRLLHKDPGQRFLSARQLAALLDERARG